MCVFHQLVKLKIKKKKLAFLKIYGILYYVMGKDTYNYKYKIINGTYAEVEAKLNILAKINPANLSLMYIKDYTVQKEMMIVVRIFYEISKNL